MKRPVTVFDREDSGTSPEMSLASSASLRPSVAMAKAWLPKFFRTLRAKSADVVSVVKEAGKQKAKAVKQKRSLEDISGIPQKRKRTQNPQTSPNTQISPSPQKKELE